MLAVVAAGCEKIEFDRDYNKIISFADPNFRERITPYFDSNGDGYISIYEAEHGRQIPYGEKAELTVVIDCDNSDGTHTALSDIDEVRFFTNAQVLRFNGNNISGTLDLKKLKSLKEIHFTGNEGIEKIIINSAVKNLVIETDPGIEIEYYTDPEIN